MEEEEEFNSTNFLNTLKVQKKEKNMYFDNEYVTDLITKYQKSLVIKDGKIIKADRKLETEIVANLMLIVNAIINKYSLWRFDELENLQAEAITECWKYIPNFDTSKGTCFNLFSLICKYHLIGYTLKEHKNRQNADVDIHPELESREEFNFTFFLESLEQFFIEKINTHFKDKKEKYLELTAILMEYLDKNGGQVLGKNDLFSCKQPLSPDQCLPKIFFYTAQQKHFHTPAGLILFPENAGRDHLGLIDHQQITFAEVLRQIMKDPVLSFACITMENQQTG